MLVKLMGTEEALGASGSSVDNARVVRLVNTSGSAQTVDVMQDSTKVGSLTLVSGEVVHLEKTPSQNLVGNSAVKAVKVAHAN